MLVTHVEVTQGWKGPKGPSSCLGPVLLSASCVADLSQQRMTSVRALGVHHPPA
jgi:hypothetical protein